MRKLRTIPKAYNYIKEQDPDSDVTLYMIRKLVEQNKVSLTRTGRKILVDVESLIAVLSGEQISPNILEIA